MTNTQRTAAILVAAGRGLRAGSGGPKQYRTIGGRAVIHRALAAFAEHPEIAVVQPVVNPDDIALFESAARDLEHATPANVGATRQASVLAVLEAFVPNHPEIVLIHDAARPF